MNEWVTVASDRLRYRPGVALFSLEGKQEQRSETGLSARDVASGSSGPVISVVLGTLNRRRFLKAAIRSIRENHIAMPYEIIVIDGGSTDGSLAWLTRQKDIITIIQHNGGEWRGQELLHRSWGYFMNLGFRCASGEYVCMVSDDCILVPGAIAEGVSHLDALRASGVMVGAGAFYFRDWPDAHEFHVQLTLGNRMMVNHGLFVRDALSAVNWIEEERYAFYHADSDLCLKLWQRGYEVVDCPNSYVEHYFLADRAGRSSMTAVERRDWQSYLDRWTGVMFDGREENAGGQVTKAYVDPCRSASRFPRLEVTLHRLSRTTATVAAPAKRAARKALPTLARNRRSSR